MYKLGNLPLLCGSEEKGGDFEQEISTEEVKEENGMEGDEAVVEGNNKLEGEIDVESKGETSIEGEVKENQQEEEIPAEPTEESLPDDKTEEITESTPTELIELSILPRENVVR